MKLNSWFKPYINKSQYLKSYHQLLKDDSITMSSQTKKLEHLLQKILNVKHIVLTNSGTTAITSAILALDKKKKLKVICTNLTWIATINSSILLNHDIYICDTLPKSEKVDFYKLNKLIKNIRPDLVFLVHLNGQPTYNEDFHKLRNKFGFNVIEDAAQSLFVEYKKNKFCGTKFDIGCFSLGITKLFHSVYGGFCSTNSPSVYKKLLAIRNNGVEVHTKKSYLQLSTHKGLNFKISDIHAQIGLISIANRRNIILKAKKIYSIYSKNINNPLIEFVKIEDELSIPMYPQIIVKNRNHFLKYFKNKLTFHTGLRAISDSYPKLKKQGIFTNSIFMSKNLIRLPSGPGYSLEAIVKICKLINSYQYKNVQK